MVEIVAEMSASHCGSLRRAYDIVDAAKECGANAVKLQTWSKDGMTCAPYKIESGPWAGRDLADLYREAWLPWEWHAQIFARCKRLGLECFSAPFDKPSVDFLETLGCPRYKIASPEIVDIPLIQYVASKGKPMVISTGMATLADIGSASVAAYPVRDITFLACVSAYPASPEDFNLATLTDLKHRAPRVGLSDHSRTTTAAVVATALGASMIERHLSVDRIGPDGGFVSMPYEFKAMVDAVREAETAIGDVKYGPTESEASSLQFRRSVWATQDIADEITEENVGSFRPNLGLSPSRLPQLIGRRVKRTIPRGTPITEDLLG